MVAHPAVVVACDVDGCDRVIAVTGEFARDYRSARAHAAALGWVVHPSEDDWCPEHGFAYGGHGVPLPYEHLRGDEG